MKLKTWFPKFFKSSKKHYKPKEMPEKPTTITHLRNDIYSLFDEPGIHPVTVRGEFKGVVLSVGDMRDKTAARLSDQLQRNERVSINEMIDIVQNSKNDH